MSRTTSVHYSPPVGCRINLIDKSGHTVIASTLSVRDKTPFKHRTPKGTPKGQEYFYVKIKQNKEWVFVKMLNSLTLPECISEDKQYVFKGELPEGGKLLAGVKKQTIRKEKESQPKITTSKQSTSFINANLLNSL